MQDNRILLCRKRHSTSLLILPGGKFETGETGEQCLRRECHEELGDVELSNVKYLGSYESPAAGDESRVVRIELFTADLAGTPHAQAEIGNLVWFGPGDDPSTLAPSLRNVILPDLGRRGIFPNTSAVGKN